VQIDVFVMARDGGTRSQRVTTDGSLVIGRGQQCALQIEGDGISRQHARVTLGSSGMRVEDVSSNWTMVGEQVLRRQTTEAPYGTPLVIGTFTLQIFPAQQAVASPQAGAAPSIIVDQNTALPVQKASRPPAATTARAAPPPVPTMSPATVNVRPGGPPPAPSTLTQPDKPKPSADGTGQVAAATGIAAEIELRRAVHKALLENLDLATLDAAKLDDPSMRPRVLTALRRIVKQMEHRIPPGVDRDALVGELADEALGLGPLERFLADQTCSEIMVVDPETIYIEQGGKLRRTEARFTDDERVRAVIERIVTPLGRRIDESSPLVDARLKDGSRVNAIIRPLALRGSCITIRKFAKVPLTIEKIISFGGLTEQMARFLNRAVLAKKNIVISGGTGSGKTTLLNILSGAIPDDERIVTIEDAAELQLKQPHVVSLETRPANMEGRGEYTIRDLVKNALRMRPDRIVVGECRGGEALDMLQAMNTGHDGSLTTTHANSPREAIARLETLVLMGGLDLPSRAIREQIAGAVNVIVQQSRLSDGTRKVTSITEVVGINDEGEVELRPIFEFVRTGTGHAGKVQGEFRATGYLPSFLDTFIVMGLVQKGEPFL